MLAFDDVLQAKLTERADRGLLRRLTAERHAVDFFTNDYLGMARSPELADAIAALHSTLGVQNGSSGSRLLGGNYPFVEAVEQNLARIFKSEAALIFNSGYTANLAVLSCLPQRGDTILYDNLAHASIKDGARLSLASRHPFRHNDPEDLDDKLRVARGRKFVVVESVYSMDGDSSPLKAIAEVANRHDAVMVVDEAHSTGVIGPDGAGMCLEENIHGQVGVRIYTFGKGMGVHGACVAGSATLIRYLVNFARPFIYTTALSQHDIVSIDCAFRFLGEHIHLQKTLQAKIALYLSHAAGLPSRAQSISAIQTILWPGNDAVRRIATALQQQGFDVRPIMAPTVPEGSERLRICLHTFNSDSEITALTSALAALS